jgi:hypothetical protein
MNRARQCLAIVTVLILAITIAFTQTPRRKWLAGDSHIHSHWSPGYDSQSPPEPIIGGDAVYSTSTNAEKAREYGLSWMVTTDHGGPNHSKLNLVQAYVELTESRKAIPQVLQFYGMELNMPAMDHHTLIMPSTPDEWKNCSTSKASSTRTEAWPPDHVRNSEAAGFARWLSWRRDAEAAADVCQSSGAFRQGNRALWTRRAARVPPTTNAGSGRVPRMEGAPGHQAGGLNGGDRGAYGNDQARTFGGFDQMTAIVGGLWFLARRRPAILDRRDVRFSCELRRSANPGSDFWPGQYQKTYVLADRTYDDISTVCATAEILRSLGDLISELISAQESGGREAATRRTPQMSKAATLNSQFASTFPGQRTPMEQSGGTPVDVIVAGSGPVSRPQFGQRTNQRKS